MEKIVKQTLLYDFYGELLTKRQREVYERVVLEDLSLSEAAQELGVSRQGIHEVIKRCNGILEEYESKLRLVEKFVNIREKVHQIHTLTEKYDAKDIETISNEILEEL